MARSLAGPAPLRPRGALCACVALALLGLGAGCVRSARSAPPTGEPSASAAPAAAPQQSIATSAGLHAVLLNGGGTPSENYQSHVVALRQLLALLERQGVPRARITVLASDGAHPAPDLARSEAMPDDGWRLEGTPLQELLAPRVSLVNTVLEGFTVLPATKASLARVLGDARRTSRPGDTLLLFVTDHGTRGEDPRGNRIVLWGRNHVITVRELSALLAGFDPRVRVVTLMSQCFSGGFAQLYRVHGRDGLPGGNVCGFFSSTEERPSYGCYPENLGRDNVGHPFHFFEALAASGSFRDAHREVLVTDRTPDVPLRTSDVYLADLLARAAQARREPVATFTDRLLRTAWQNRAAWEPELRLIDQIGQAFGLPSPRSLAELDERARPLPELAEQLATNAKAWESALGDMNQATVGRFLQSRADWVRRLNPTAVRRMDARTLSATSQAFLSELAAFTAGRKPVAEQLDGLVNKAEACEGAAYRMEVRQAAVLRIRSILTRIAGRVYLSAAGGTAAERAGFEALSACEDLRLPAVPDLVARRPQEPFPSLDDERQIAREVLPAWLGIGFRETPPSLRTRFGLPEGAASVMAVYPSSPAASAGLEAGDIVIGALGCPFTERHQIRTWTMLSPADQPQDLDVLRGGARVRVRIVPKPFPVEWPELPGPPRVGAVAPPVRVTPYRGALPPTGGPQLLFFWATWCGPCKAALPAVLSFARERQIPVLAITDEPASELDAFFRRFNRPFPDAVAIDEPRQAFAAFGVSGTPTFVLIEPGGKVGGYGVGYVPGRGLNLSAHGPRDR